ncbi:MAG: DNA-3-methyladenine glycosylase I [Candidatus Glassbacteria bacterium]|nr:DNA-3-methyladenine glycosylase I [Candidatus Glassbacteria bacterium]
MKKRCSWVPLDNPLYVKYHDREWGVPVRDDRLMFEFLTLESAQAGLSWLTVLRKRENYRAAFDNFDPGKVARYGEDKLAGMLADPGLIRNRQKLSAAINNARAFLRVQEEFGSFCEYIWGFVDNRPVVSGWETDDQVPANTPLSAALSKDLKQRGFKFVGSTVVYSHLQATGLVNDHTVDCFRFRELTG